ncbi:hypothetical protein FACS1894156_8170 [Bacteroidia bacterium]|nr:hypothetical protein FACS1894156_8170 [Bacteroidia bacterium]
MPCDVNTLGITATATTGSSVTHINSSSGTVSFSTGGKTSEGTKEYVKTATVRSTPTKGNPKDYTITITRPFGQNVVAIKYSNSTLFVNNNENENGGYKFKAFQWFRNGELIGNGTAYTQNNETPIPLNSADNYSVIFTTSDGQALPICNGKIEF